MGDNTRRASDAERRRGTRPLQGGPVTLVVDASVAVPACLSLAGFAPLGDADLVAPPLLWSEARSVLHELLWRSEIDVNDARAAHTSLQTAPVRLVADDRLGETAWRLADELGWAKTYDAEYVAHAQLLRCRCVTLDARLRRGADRLGFVVAPGEL